MANNREECDGYNCGRNGRNRKKCIDHMTPTKEMLPYIVMFDFKNNF